MSEWDFLFDEVQKIELSALVAQQAAERMADDFIKATRADRFINWSRVDIQISLHHLMSNQPNEFLKKMVLNSFAFRIMEHNKALV